MLSDSSHEIRQQADSALSEFLQEIKNSPVSLLFFCTISSCIIFGTQMGIYFDLYKLLISLCSVSLVCLGYEFA